MAFIPEVTEEQADESLRQCYSDIRDTAWPLLSEWFRSTLFDPAALARSWTG